MSSSEEPFGWSTTIDLYDCTTTLLTDGDHIAATVITLCDDVLLMRRFGDPILEWFGLADPKTAGYSVVQLIETSAVVGHFSADRASAYLDVFSCAPYDDAAAAEFCRQAFGAERVVTTTTVRH